jgi:hypothetical protein
MAVLRIQFSGSLLVKSVVCLNKSDIKNILSL